MKINCWSDLHEELPLQDSFDEIGDVFVCAGDLIFDPTNVDAYKRMIAQIGKLPHDNKVVVPGNHDPNQALFDKHGLCEFAKTKGVDILIDDSISINGVKFYGFPWSPTFGTMWSWMLDDESEEFVEKVNKIDVDTDVVISHGPCFQIHDLTYGGDNVGSKSLLKRIIQVKPKLVVVGHIHEGHGQETKSWGSESETIFVNAAHGYRDEQHPPITVEI